VTTVCPGPAAGRTGPVAGGQTLAVARGGAATATPDRPLRSMPGSFLQVGRRPLRRNSSSSRTPVPRTMRGRMDPGLRRRAVRRYRCL